MQGPPEDQPLISAINDAPWRYGFSAAAAEQLLDEFTKPEPKLRQWIFELCDSAPGVSPFVASDHLGAFARDVLTSGPDHSAGWAELTTRERRQARRIERFTHDKHRVCMLAGRPQNVGR